MSDINVLITIVLVLIIVCVLIIISRQDKIEEDLKEIHRRLDHDGIEDEINNLKIERIMVALDKIDVKV